MDRLVYFCFLCFINLFRFLPFRLLYWFSDVVYLFIHYIACYRKQVVLSNLQNSFPDKNIGEIKLIAKQFYHHFSDLLIESLKSFTVSEAELIPRYEFRGIRILNGLFEKGQSAICVAGHYGNWEWGGVVSGNQIKHKPVGFYKPLTNRYVDEYVRRSRVKGRSVLAPITLTAETFSTVYEEPALFFMVADQSPSTTRLAYWVDFLNQDTAALHGPEKYARIHNLPVVFASVEKVRRGFYAVEFKLLEADPLMTEAGEITTRFMKMLEADIKRNPQYYLWSHRRWKHRRGGQVNK